MARIALVNVPFRSHIAAMLRLGGVLVRQGHALVVWAPEEWREAVAELGGRFEPSSPEMPRTLRAALPAALAATAEREAERLIPRLHAHDVDLVVRDSQATWGLIAAQYLGIPRIVSHPMFPMGGPGEPSNERWPSIARRWNVTLADVHGLHHRASEPTLIFTTEEIIGDQALVGDWRCIGPLLSGPPPRVATGRPPLVYASFGTAQNRRTSLFRLVIAAVAELPVRLLVSTGGRSIPAGELGPRPANVTVRKFVPAREVLARASVHITHGGCNSVHESLVAGVPMVCLPQAFDQIPLSRRVEELGAGVVVAPDPVAVARAVLTLLDDGELRTRIQTIAEQLRGFDGEARVAAAVAGCL